MPNLSPVIHRSLKDLCIDRIEDFILAGEYPIGSRLPPERDMAVRLAVSRPVVHEALVELAGRGLLRIIPRIGTVVNDYRSEGSVELLLSLQRYQKGKIGTELMESLLEMRLLFETEIVRLAALRSTGEHLEGLHSLLREERDINPEEAAAVADLDYRFHHALAIASGNMIYPVLMNSYKSLYLRVLERFYSNRIRVDEIFKAHEEIVRAVSLRNDAEAADRMEKLLRRSEFLLQEQTEEGSRRNQGKTLKNRAG